MINLRNPDLRTRDIRKLVGLKAQFVRWDEGCDETSEWVIAAVDSSRSIEKLLSWLNSKNVAEFTDCLITNSAWSKPEMIQWHQLLDNPSKYFGNASFQLYDIDLKWVLEYATQEVARFGVFDDQPNA